jgi:hypothetical protein
MYSFVAFQPNTRTATQCRCVECLRGHPLGYVHCPEQPYAERRSESKDSEDAVDSCSHVCYSTCYSCLVTWSIDTFCLVTLVSLSSCWVMDSNGTEPCLTTSRCRRMKLPLQINSSSPNTTTLVAILPVSMIAKRGPRISVQALKRLPETYIPDMAIYWSAADTK